MKDELKLPKVGEYVRGVGTLVEIDTPPPPPPQKDYIFEESTARIEVRRNGLVMNTHGTRWDYYGLGTSVETAIHDAKKLAKDEGYTPQSECALVVVKIVSYIRKRPGAQENSDDPKYREFKALDHGCRLDLPPDSESVVWSSKWKGKSCKKK